MFIWDMLFEIHMDLGAYFVRHLTKVGRASTGNIVVGGMITPIALMIYIDWRKSREAIG